MGHSPKFARVMLILSILALGCGAEEFTADEVGETSQGLSRQFTTWQWNISGNVMHRGRTDDGLIEAAVNSIISRGADFAAFNEICLNQYYAIGDMLVARGWQASNVSFRRFHINLTANDGQVHCGEVNGKYGDALFSKFALGTAEYTRLAYDGKIVWNAPEYQGLMCAPLASSPTMRFCVTHLATGSTFNVQQLDQVQQQLAAKGGTWILLGDLNTEPQWDRLNDWYNKNSTNNPNNTGTYVELDDLDTYPSGIAMGEWTSGIPLARKLDFHFVPANKITAGTTYDLDAVGTTAPLAEGGYSDHRITVGHVTLNY